MFFVNINENWVHLNVSFRSFFVIYRSTFWAFMKVQNPDRLELKILILQEGPHKSMKHHIGTRVMFYIRSHRTTLMLWRGCVAFLISDYLILWQSWLTFLKQPWLSFLWQHWLSFLWQPWLSFLWQPWLSFLWQPRLSSLWPTFVLV